jgi:adenosylcobinamide-GDP ribazoletransferase
MLPLALRAAARHLTIAPLKWDPAEANAGGTALVWFPFIGLAVGAVVYAVLQLPLPPLLSTAFGLFAWIALSAGLHEDAVMDCADAAFAPVTLERREAIRKDPRVGAHAVTFFGLLLLIRFAALHEAPGLAALVAPLAGRWTMAVTVAFGRPRSAGLSSAFSAAAPRVLPSLCAISMLCTIAWWSDPRAVPVAFSALGFGWLGAAWFARRLGGYNGDVHGTGGVLAETCTLALMAALR